MTCCIHNKKKKKIPPPVSQKGMSITINLNKTQTRQNHNQHQPSCGYITRSQSTARGSKRALKVVPIRVRAK